MEFREDLWWFQNFVLYLTTWEGIVKISWLRRILTIAIFAFDILIVSIFSDSVSHHSMHKIFLLILSNNNRAFSTPNSLNEVVSIWKFLDLALHIIDINDIANRLKQLKSWWIDGCWIDQLKIGLQNELYVACCMSHMVFDYFVLLAHSKTYPFDSWRNNMSLCCDNFIFSLACWIFEIKIFGFWNWPHYDFVSEPLVKIIGFNFVGLTFSTF